MSLRLPPPSPSHEPEPQGPGMETIRTFLAKGEKPAVDFATSEDRRAWIHATLERLGYEYLSREEKGLVRQYLITVTGYSRAQVERLIRTHRNQGSEITVQKTRSSRIFANAISISRSPAALVTAMFLLLVLTQSRSESRLPASLVFLNEDATDVSDDGSNGQKKPPSGDALVASVLPTGQGSASVAPLYTQTNEIVTLPSGARVVRRRLIAPAEPRKAVQKTSVLKRSPLTAAAQRIIDIFGPGRDGQVLMYENGVAVWKNVPKTTILRGSAPTDNDSNGRRPTEARGDEGRRFGGGGTNPNSDGRIETHDHETDPTGGILNINAAMRGVLAASRGGTGFGSYSTGDLLVGNAGGGLNALGVGANGQVLSVSNGNLAWGSAGAGDLTQANADTRFVNVSGDTMTGALIINGFGLTASGQVKAGGAFIGSGALIIGGAGLIKGDLTINSDAGAADILLTFASDGVNETLKFLNNEDRFEFSDDVHVTATLTASGTVVFGSDAKVKGDFTINSDAGAADTILTFGSDSTNETLKFLNNEDRFEFSDDLRTTGNLYSSGTLIVDAATILKSTIRLNGVTYTFPLGDGTASGKVLKTNSAGQLSWSTDSNDGGSGLSYTDARSYFVDDSGDTMTGALIINGAGLTASGQIRSGSDVIASGALVIGGAGLIKGDFTINSDAGAADTILTFGSDGANETLKFLNAEDHFEFSDDLNVTGGLYASGVLIIGGAGTVKGDFTINSDLTDGNTAFTFGSDDVSETLTFLDAADRFEFSDDLRTTGNLYSSGTLIVDGATVFKSTIKLNGVTYTFPTSDGTASGKVLATNAAGQLSWTNAADPTAINQTNADVRYVNVSGDTMTGALAIKKAAGTSTGNTLIVDTKGLVYDATNKRVGIGTASPLTALEVKGAISGNSLQVTGTIISSGAVVFGSDAKVKGDFTINSDAGAADALLTFGSDTLNETLKFMNNEDRFEFSNDINVTGALYSSGALIVLSDSKFKGDLIINSDAGAADTILTFGSDGANETIKFLNNEDRFELSDDLNVTLTLTASGTVVFGSDAKVKGDLAINSDATAADTALTFGSTETLKFLNTTDRFEFSDDLRTTGNLYSSGSLIVDGATVFKSTIRLNGVTYTFPTSDGTASGKVLKTNSAGQLSWSTDLNSGGSGISYTEGSSWFVDQKGDTMTGALIINGAGLTASGQIKSASDIIGSGALVIGGAGLIKGDFTINSDAGAANTVLTFGSDSINETLTFLNAVDRFEFSNDVAATGNIYASGALIVTSDSKFKGDLTINSDQGAADAILTFGSDSTNETLKFLNNEDRFEFSDDLNVTGGLYSSGVLIVFSDSKFKGDLTINSDQGAADTILTFGSDSTNETLKFLNAEDRFEFSDDFNATGTITASGGLVVNTAAVFKSTVRLNGVTYTFPFGDGTASGKVLKTNAAGQLSWSTDSNDGGSGLSYADARSYFVDDSGDTMTGALIINGFGLTASGQIKSASDLIASGALIIGGAGLIKGDLTINSDAGAVDTILTFGSDGANETIKFLNNEDRFEFSDDLNVTGGLYASGVLIIGGAGTIKGNLTTRGTLSGASLKIMSGAVSYVLGSFGIGTANPAVKLEVAGPLRLSGPSVDGFLTPVGNVVPTKINVPIFDPGAFGQIIAMGLSSGAQDSSRVMSLADPRLSAHQPTLLVISPDENQAFGLSWDGSNTAAYLKGSKALGFRVDGLLDSLVAMFINTDGNVGIGSSTASPSTKLEVVGTISGSFLYASTNISTSGTVIIRNAMSGGSGALLVEQRVEFSTGAYFTTSGAAILALDSADAESLAGDVMTTPHILFGYKGKFDVDLYRSSGATLRTRAKLLLTSEDANNRELLRLDSEETTSTQNLFVIRSDVSGNEDIVFRVQADGTVLNDNGTYTTGADYAEWFYSVDRNLKSGEVVCIDITRDNAVKRCTRSGDANVMGIISTKPAFVGNNFWGAEGLPVPGYVLVGLIGQVPAHVLTESGAIRPGDSLTPASRPGFARKANAGEPTVGVALEGLEGTEGMVNVLIARRNESMSVEAVEQQIYESVAAMELEDEVQLLVTDTLKDMNFNATINEEVRTQVKDIDFTAEMNALIDTRLGTAGALSQLEQQNLFALDPETSVLTIDAATTLGRSLRVMGDASFSGALTAMMGTFLDISIDRNLTVGGSARVGKDLHVDGELVVKSILSEGGLYVDGDLNLGGVIHASGIELASGATLRLGGGLVIDGALKVESLEFTEGGLTIPELIVRDAVEILGNITVRGLAEFFGDVSIVGELKVSKNQAGYAIIPMSQTSMDVRFGSGFAAMPIVTASPDIPVLYAVSKATQSGFTIRLAAPALEDITFSWLALATDDPSTMKGSAMEESLQEFPVDHLGVPLSTNDIWNACIRNLTVLDAEGKPYSCDRYHEDTLWTHPDLGITFAWNTRVTPPLLQLPEGYVAVTQEPPAVEATPEETPLPEEVLPEDPMEESSETPEDTPAESPELDTPSDAPAEEPEVDTPSDAPAEEPEEDPAVVPELPISPVEPLPAGTPDEGAEETPEESPPAEPAAEPAAPEENSPVEEAAPPEAPMSTEPVQP